MPGSFGTTQNEDGAIASTRSSDHSGLFARNDGTQQPAAGKPGGNGVFGFSTVPDASGVFGVNDGPQGCGVAGSSQRGDGMRASTASAARSGIFAQNTSRDAAPEGAPAGNGVFGLSLVPNASGVFGAHNNGGNGIAGFSEKGVGVWAAGGRLAAQFVGDVDVSGRLVVGGADVAGMSGEIARLRSELDELVNFVTQLAKTVSYLSSVK